MRSLISIPAGIAKMKIPQFLFLTILGSTIWNTLLIYTGAGLGTAWQSALPYFDRYTNLALILLAALAVLLILAWQFRNTAKKHPPPINQKFQNSQTTPEISEVVLLSPFYPEKRPFGPLGTLSPL
jgi:TRAP-type C4-dicarboxylate transport system permease small subunit